MLSNGILHRLTILITCAGFAAAQVTTRRRRHSLAGRIIAGIVVGKCCPKCSFPTLFSVILRQQITAIVFGLLLIALCCLLCVRRRRRGLGVLPGPNGGYGRFNVPFAGVNQRPTAAVPAYNPEYTGHHHHDSSQAGYQQSQGVVPPPYLGGKEQYGGSNGVGVQPGGFAPPPGPPPAAYVNDNVGDCFLRI